MGLKRESVLLATSLFGRYTLITTGLGKVITKVLIQNNFAFYVFKQKQIVETVENFEHFIPYFFLLWPNLPFFL